MIYWFTGQPGAGKTTLANHLVTHLHLKKPVLIDGDDIRKIFSNKDYSETGRRKNVELAQNLAHFLHDKGHNVCVALVSPYKDQRDNFKEKFSDNIKEVYVHAFIDRGRTQYHVSDYEKPTEDYIDIDTTNDTEFESYKKLITKLGL
jgi:adenylylsulfate kinase-like enzyme